MKNKSYTYQTNGQICRRGKVAKKLAFKLAEIIMKPRVQSRRTTAVKKSVRRKRPNVKVRGTTMRRSPPALEPGSVTHKEKVSDTCNFILYRSRKRCENNGRSIYEALQSIPEAKELIIN